MERMDLEALLDEVRRFKREREWDRYHNPKDLAISIVLEASELLEIFQWVDPSELPDIVEKKIERIKEEIADVFLYLLSLCDVLGLDIVKIGFEKLKLNEKKYPVEKFRGSYRKYNEPPIGGGTGETT